MKNFFRNSYVLLCTLACLLYVNVVFSQQTLTQINGWNAYVHLPANYNSTTTSYPTIIFFPGLGEVGTNASAVIANGPGAYITQGWNGNVVVDGSTVEFIVISLQPPTAYPTEIAIDQKIQTIKSLYRVNNNKLYLTGLSHGGWCSSTFVTGDPFGGPYKYASQIAAVVEVQGMVPDDNSPYPNLFDNYALSGGKLLGFQQTFDNRDVPRRVDRMNATKPGSAIYVPTNFGGGGHCCWNQYYGGQGTQPGNFMLAGVNQNIYQWLSRQTLGTVINQAPIANAGPDKIITLPTTSTTLNGSGTDADGTITSFLWTKVSGPAAGNVANANTAQASLSALAQGVYEYELKVTDNGGNTGTDLVKVTVNAATNVPPNALAGSDLTITLPVNFATLSGAGNDSDGSIVSYLWTKISGPASGTITSPSTAVTTVTGLLQGSHVFQLRVTDNQGATATDNITVIVNPVAIAAPAPTCNSNAPVTHTLSQTGTGEIYRPNGSLWKGGDTIKITGTNYSVIEFYNVGGDACRPLVIMPMTTLVTPTFRFKGDCRYIKLWGGKTKYGIKVNGGSLAISYSHHIEVDNVECTGGNTGVYCKQDVVYGDPTTWNPNYRMTKFTFKNMWIHDISGEGMYIGVTLPDGWPVKSTYSGLDTLIVPIRLDSVEVSNCIVERTQWDAIQISNARYGTKIFNNTVRDYGTINKGSQQSGIILGGNTNGDIYGNTISRGTGNGIQVFGYGVINIYNNTLDSCGYDGSVNTNNGTQGQQSIYASDYITTVESNPKQTIKIYGNAINRAKTAGAVFITGYSNNSLPSSVYNNTYCIQNPPANWQSIYIKSYVVGSTISNNTLSCSAATNAVPTVNAGSDIILILPANNATLTGSGSDADGTITGYQWRKISGPVEGTIGSATNASTAFSNLAQGVYQLELQVTDNSGAAAKDTVQITVNASAITLLPAVNPANTVNGLDYKYYQGTWSMLPSFSSLTPLRSGTVAIFDLTPALQTTEFGFSYTGFITVPADGQYTFYTSSDDGSQLYIDNVLTVDNDGLHATTEKSGVIGLKAGKHAITGFFFQNGGEKVFTVSYQGTGLAKQVIPAAALYRINVVANSIPTANAGADQNVAVNAVTLTGSGTDADGSITQYQWTKISGPGCTITNATNAATTVTGLTSGTYVFQLTVTDNLGATATDQVQAIITIPATSGGKRVKVNLFGGSNALTDLQWNNWNLLAGATSSNFLYEDRTASTIKASLSGDLRIADNGTNYVAAAILPPSAVLRFNAFATSQRELNIQGLNPSKSYSFEFFASRKNSGHKSVYTIGNLIDTINTDNNVNDVARFVNIVPDNTGSVKVTISRIGVYNYLAGFTIIEQLATIAPTAQPATIDQPATPATKTFQGETLVEMNSNTVSVYPNPFAGSFKVQLNQKAAGEYVMKLSASTGQTVFYKKVSKPASMVVETINVGNLTAGTYILEIISVANGSRSVHKVIKN